MSITASKAIDRATRIRYDYKKEEADLKALLDKLVKYECREPGKWSEDVRKVKLKLERLDEQRYRGALVRARADDSAAGKMPSKRALGLEKARAESDMLPMACTIL